MPLLKPDSEKVRVDAWTTYMAIRTILLPDFSVGFVRLRKNASSSLTVALNESSKKEARDVRIPTKPRYEYVHGTEAMRNASNGGFYLSAIVRDPVDRLVGAWHYFRDKNVNRFMPDTDLPLEDWIIECINADPYQLDEHVAPQSIQITDNRGLIPQRLLRHERIADDWSDLAGYVKEKPYGLWLREFPHENKRANKAKTIQPSPAVAKEVRRLWDFDYKVLGYDVT